MLSRTPLLTLTGSGGSGKTRLALHLAGEVMEAYTDGVWLVELAPLADPGLVPQAVATVFGLKEEPGKSILLTLTQYLKSKNLLLLLDNCEHLLTACGQLVDGILRHCSQVVILASSREGLGIGGETTYRVPSLSLPDPKRDITPEALARFEAVRLFTERAMQVKTGFEVTPQNAAALASVCHRLDGIPLAIELAAARVRAMPVEQIEQRLDQRFRLLAGGSRTALPRQQTLRSLIDWSYDLLSVTEKALMGRRSVFSGGWTLEAAEQVCGGDPVEEWEVLDLLTSLSDKSLVTYQETASMARYRLLETVRQYARDRLLESGVYESWRERHLAHFLALTEEAEPHLSGKGQVEWLERLEREHDNLRAAVAWSCEGTLDEERDLRLCARLWRFWYIRGYIEEGRYWCRVALERTSHGGRTSTRATTLNGAGVLAWSQGDYASARSLSEESLSIRRELGDRRGIALSLNSLGNVAHNQGDYSTARSLNEESLAIQRELGDRRGIAFSLNNLGNVAGNQGDYSTARSLHEESLATRREQGDRQGIALSLNNLGTVAHNQGDYSTARSLFEEALAIRRELGDRKGIAESLNCLGNVAKEQGDYSTARPLHAGSLAIRREIGDRQGIAYSLEGIARVAAAVVGSVAAAHLWGTAERLREEIGAPLSPNERLETDGSVAAARAALADPALFGAAWQEGREMTLEQAIERALELEVRDSV